VKRLLYTNFTTSHDRLVAIDESLARPWRRTLSSVEAPVEEKQCRVEALLTAGLAEARVGGYASCCMDMFALLRQALNYSCWRLFDQIGAYLQA